MTDPAEAWTALEPHGARLRARHLRALFEDPRRFTALSARLDDLVIDFSKEKLDQEALAALVTLARTAGVEARRDAMARGARINTTEDRAVLHMALRGGAAKDATVDGQEVMPEVLTERVRMLDFAEAVRTGRYATVSGAPFRHIVNIGIGGSDLGPAMASQALSPWGDGPVLHYVSNVDGSHLADTLKGLDPAETLVIVASKTFTTLETMTNARAARNWLDADLGASTGRHMAALSTNLKGAARMGIDASRVFGFWDWVGGRYSIWSSIGLPLAIEIGAAAFQAFLDGAAEMDQHFTDAPLDENLPVLLALVGIWRRNVMGWPGHAVIPYDQRLARLPAYFQQLDMESNGKSVAADGTPLTRASGPLVFGEPGTNAQHSFFQLLHQGTDVVPVDFLLAAEPVAADADQHAILVSSALAQARALAFGRDREAARAAMADLPAEEAERLAPHRAFPGDRPSTTILYRRLDPRTLGRLIALFEHKVFVQGVIWGLNSFDQWGVELGKALTSDIRPKLASGETEGLDSSTAGLIHLLRGQRSG